MPFKFHLTGTSISIGFDFVITSMSCRFHFDPTLDTFEAQRIASNFSEREANRTNGSNEDHAANGPNQFKCKTSPDLIKQAWRCSVRTQIGFSFYLHCTCSASAQHDLSSHLASRRQASQPSANLEREAHPSACHARLVSHLSDMALFGYS